MVIKGRLCGVVKVSGGCILGGCLLWQVAEHGGPQSSEVVVHVTEAPSVVAIDGLRYSVATWPGAPIVCELSVGWHELRMWRGNRLVYREEFRVRPGENIVLTAWDPRARRAASTTQVSAVPVLDLEADGK